MAILRTLFSNKTFMAAALTLVALFSTQVKAKTLASQEKMDKISEQFMSQVQAGEFETAYTILSAYLGVDMQGFLDRGKKVQQDMQQFQQNVGKPISYALLEKQSVGEHFYKVVYLLKYDTAALIWEINFYQPDQGWKLVDVSFNANINALFK